MAPDSASPVASILNAAWMVRHYGRQRSGLQRKQAIQMMGLAVREAFNRSDDFEALLAAVVDGLRPRDEQQPF